MRVTTIIMALLISGAASAQVGIAVGGSMLKAFGQPSPYGGFHVGVEVPRDDAVSLYARITHHFKQRSTDSTLAIIEAIDPLTTFPSIKNIKGLSSFNYTMIEGGTRYYLGNGYDFGWAAYGGTNIMLAFNSAKMEYEGYDETLYKISGDDTGKGSIVSFGVGLSGGVKYSMTSVGTFYFDAGLAYLIYALPSNNLAGEIGLSRFSSLLFNFTLGIRRDIMW